MTPAERIDAAADTAARRLGMATPSPDVRAAARAAWSEALKYTGRTDDTLPDDGSIAAGLAGWTVRIYLDTVAPGGTLGSDTYPGVPMPRDLAAHISDYFDHARDYTKVGVPG